MSIRALRLVPLCLAALAARNPAPTPVLPMPAPAPLALAPHPAGPRPVFLLPTCSWRASGGGWVTVTCQAWNSCTMTKYDSNGNVVAQMEITPDICS
ncbi:MAG TPA: hypothetical protein VJ570_11875 [Holophagaceae bacterium]|nr:hypothetical protein [Holophagaceae bacterium]